jgi:diaminohydroxyphosphoribosylaminopyrimidine deaminase/5-amino-6-(5-phosphoribosylamino)uracil reductase
MRRALALAEQGAGQVAPNPMVGAVLVRNGHIISEGFHEHFGGAHAEVIALQRAGVAAQGCTVYVTLEPCNHTGKTPPCALALRNAMVSRVVYAVADPNPVAAGGASFLREAGIAITAGVLEREARDLNAPFFHALRGSTRPYVTLKLAVSIDGAIVDRSRARGWLTGLDARRAVHGLRAQSDAIAVGIGTVLADDPALTVREWAPPRISPLRVVFDRQARLPLASTLVHSARIVPVIVVTDGSAPARESALREAGVTVLRATTTSEGLELLSAAGVRHLLVEGGATLASSLLDAGLIDRLITFQGPVILGAGALAAFASLPSRTTEAAPRLRVIGRREFGADLMTTYAVSGD